jgi:hypothetical protein
MHSEEYYITLWRHKNPTTPILVSKFDIKSAYRRIHQHGTLAIQSCISTADLGHECAIALASLRATFGGTQNPALWSLISEPLTDLANALVRCPDWNPSQVHSRFSELIQQAQRENPSIPFAPAEELIASPPQDGFAMFDVFLDDLIAVILDLSANHVTRGTQAPLLVIDIISRPVAHETMQRDEVLAIDKAMAEATPSEVQKVLGWVINTRTMLVSLPEDKHFKWTLGIQEILSHPTNAVATTTLDTLIGRLQHVATIIPAARHFVSRLRNWLTRSQRWKPIPPPLHCLEDLRLWLAFINRAREGININLLVNRAPTSILRTDACEYGLGGFNVGTGRAWQYRLPDHLLQKQHINFLEFLACSVGVFLELIEIIVENTPALHALPTTRRHAGGYANRSSPKTITPPTST